MPTPYTEEELCGQKCANDFSDDPCNNILGKTRRRPFYSRVRLISPVDCKPFATCIDGETVPLWVNKPTFEKKIYNK